MSRNARWFEFVRGLAEDQQALIGDIIKNHEEMMIAYGNGGYHKNDGLFIKHNLDLRDLMARAQASGKKFLEVLEDNKKTAADIEMGILERYRLKERTE